MLSFIFCSSKKMCPIDILLNQLDVNEWTKWLGLDCGCGRVQSGLLVASLTGNSGLVRQLIKQPGVDINLADKEGNTALHLAAQAGKLLLTFIIALLVNICKGRVPLPFSISNVVNINLLLWFMSFNYSFYWFLISNF